MFCAFTDRATKMRMTITFTRQQSGFYKQVNISTYLKLIS